MSNARWPSAGHKITVAPSGVIKQPAFRTRYPQIINADLIEPGSRSVMDESWKRDYFEERDAEYFRLSEVYVVGECLILDNQLRVLTNVSDAYTDEEIEWSVRQVQTNREAETLPHFDRPTILSKRRAGHNYGHYLMENLPMAVVGGQVAKSDNPLYLVHLVPPATMDVVFRSFRLLGIDMDQILVQATHEPMYFEDLLVVRGLTKHGTYMSALSLMATNKMSQRLVDIADTMPGRGHDKLFVRRVPGWRRGRQLHNEGEIARRLSNCGYWSVNPGQMSLDQQIRLFSRAKLVVGVIGAAMTNIAFCRTGTRAILLVPGAFPDTFFWFIAQHKGLSYLEIRGDQTTNGTPDSWYDGFTIREKDIEYLEQIRSTDA